MSKRDLAVMKLLAKGRTIVFTATALDLMPNQVTEVAREHGALKGGQVNVDAAALAVKRLTAAETPRIAERAEPAPVATPPVAARRQPSAASAAPPVRGDFAAEELLEVPIGDVRPDPLNLREDVGDVAELAASLVAVGMLQPIVVRRDGTRFYVVAGHRRLAAAKLAGWKTVRVIARRAMRPDAVIAAMLVENGHRRDLDPIEEARGLNRLRVEAGDVSHAEIAKRVGRTQVHVSGRLALLALPIADQEALRAGQMTLTEAVHKARVASGRVKPKGQDKGWHLGPQHALFAAAKARCQRLKHPRGRGVGGGGCGACWESVIRADERQGLHAHAARTSECSICGGGYAPTLNGHHHPNREDQPA